MKRPEFMTSGTGPTADCPHAAKRQVERLDDQIRIEQGILERLPALFRREQELRIAALMKMPAEARQYAWYLWKKERAQ
jgi:hypothetical protein